MQKNTPYFRNILRSYALAVLLPVGLLCTLLYRMGVVELVDAESASRRANLSNVAVMLNKQINEYNNMALMMSMEDSLQSISPQMDIESSIAVVQRLKSYVNTNTFFDSVVIQRDNVPLLYTSGGTMNINVFTQRAYSLSPEEEQTFLTLLLQKRATTHYFSSAHTIMSFLPFPLLGQTKTGCVVYVISMEQLVSMLNLCMDDSRCAFALVNDVGEVLFSYNGSNVSPDWGALADYTSDKPVHIGGADCTVVTRKVTSLQWTLVWLRDYSSFFWNSRVELLLISVVSVLFISIALILHHARRQYKPIQQISSKLETKSVNELESISRAVNEYQTLNERVLEQKRMLRQGLLQRILSGEMIEKAEIFRMCEALDIFVHSGQIQVLSIIFKNQEDLERLNACAARIEQTARGAELYALVQLYDHSIAVVCGKDYVSNGLAALEECVSSLEETPPVIGVSTPCSAERMAVALLEAQFAAESTLEKRGSGVTFFTAYQSALQMDTGFRKQEQQFIYHLRQGNEEEAVALLDALIDAMKDRHPPRQMWRYYQFQIVESISRVISDEAIAQRAQEQEYARLSSLLTVALANSSYEEFEKWGRNIAHDICGVVRRLAVITQDEAVQKVTEWIRLHLTDPALSLDMLAGDMGFSNTYWSRFFRERMSVSFNDCVSEMRMERCRELLANTDLAVKEIVAQVGYLDTSSFIRKFRQQQGCTPMQYRTNMRKQDGG